MAQPLDFTPEQFQRDVRVQARIHGLDPRTPEIQALIAAAAEHVARGQDHVVAVLQALDPKPFTRQDLHGTCYIMDTRRGSRELALLKTWTLARWAITDLDQLITEIRTDYHGTTIYHNYRVPLIEIPGLYLPQGNFDSAGEHATAIAELICHLTGLPLSKIHAKMAAFDGKPVTELYSKRLDSSKPWNPHRLHATTQQG